MPASGQAPTSPGAEGSGPDVTASAEAATPPESAALDVLPTRPHEEAAPPQQAVQLPEAVPVAASRPADWVGPVAIVGQVLSAAAQEIVRVVRPEAAVAVATEFGFPLVLALAVLGYLLIQGYVDRRDPKLRMAPQTSLETIMQFKTEEQL